MDLFSRQYGDQGAEDALIILHGFLGSSTNGQSLAKRFATKRRVYSLDCRNHGQSPWSEHMNYGVMAQDVLRFIESIHHNRITVLGHSMGGKVAMKLALEHPNSVDALIIADIAPVHYQHDFSSRISTLLALDLAHLKSRKQADSQLLPNIPDAAERAFLLHNLAFDEVNKIWSWRPNLTQLLNSMSNIMDFSLSEQQTYKQASLFIHGGRSDYLQPQHIPLIEQYFTASQFHCIAEAGHWLHADQPMAFCNACEQFLSYEHRF